MERPLSRIVGQKLDLHRLHRIDDHSVFRRGLPRSTRRTEQTIEMTMQVHWMAHHALIDQTQSHPLALAYLQIIGFGERLIIDCPAVGHHASIQDTIRLSGGGFSLFSGDQIGVTKDFPTLQYRRNKVNWGRCSCCALVTHRRSHAPSRIFRRCGYERPDAWAIRGEEDIIALAHTAFQHVYLNGLHRIAIRVGDRQAMTVQCDAVIRRARCVDEAEANAISLPNTQRLRDFRGLAVEQKRRIDHVHAIVIHR